MTSPLSREEWQNFVAGEWVDGSTHDLIDPSSEKVIGTQHYASKDTIEDALNSARDVVDRDLLTSPHPRERSIMLRAIASGIRRLAPQITASECYENGKPFSMARAEAEEAARIFDYYSGLADKLEGQSIPLGHNYIDYTEAEPHGVTLHIVPFNYPLGTAARSVAPALAAGNACIVKTPEASPSSALLLANAVEGAGLPIGALSILNGEGATVGAGLVSDHRVDHVVFTGSVTSGKAVLHSAAERVIPTVMELGGKSAAILCDDADIERALDAVMIGCFSNSGQICSACTRLIVPKNLLQTVVLGLRERINRLTLAQAHENPDMGPLISGAQRDRVNAIIAGFNGEMFQGVAPPDTGFFVSPTLVVASPNEAIAQEEIFGPVLTVLPAADENEAIEIANGTAYGLVAGVFTRDLSAAHRISRKLRAGQIFVNGWFLGGIETPFGGIGASGFGREKGIEGLQNYVRTKNIAIAL